MIEGETAERAAASSTVGRLLAILAALAIIAVSFLAQGIGWGGALFGLPSDAVGSAVTATAVQALLLAGPLALLAYVWPPSRYRAMFRTWLAAAAILLALSLARLFPSAESQLAYLAQTAILLVAFLFLRWRALAGGAASMPGGRFALAAALGLFAGLPWIRIGALGSLLDLVIAACLALAFGLVAAQLVARFWLRPLETTARSPRRDFLTGGFIIGVAWLILASGVSLNGLQLALMLGLPALGWGAMGVARLGSGKAHPGHWSVVALLVGATAWCCLAFVDPDGMALVIGDSILGDALRASLVVALIGWLIGLLTGLQTRQVAPAPTAPTPARLGPLLPLLALAVALLSAGVLHASGGQTGAHGDRLFVVLRDQADVSDAASMSDYDARRRRVYEMLVDHADRTQAPLRASLDRLGVAYTPYYLVNAIEVEGGLPIRLWLEAQPSVARVMPSPSLRPPQSALAVISGSLQAPLEPQWNLTSIGATRAWEELGARGQGIVVGESDSGVQYDHPELADAYRGRDGDHDYDWYDPWYGEATPVDFGGHGTHTLGSVLGNSVGVAPDAEWIACANLPRNLGSPARYLDCLQFMFAPFPSDGDPLRDGDPLLSAHVLNNSWGCPQEYEGCDPESLRPAVAALRAAGIFVVASAGNEGPGCTTLDDPIALYDEVFTVGAIDEEGDLADFSSRGPVLADGSRGTKPDIVAPGVDILSAFPQSTYESNSGTSMAGPHVAGVVALMWSANADLIGDIDRTEEILIATARPYSGSPPERCGDTAPTPNNATGYGVVDAYEATKRAVELR
jgi:subtilisin family serine protease